MSVTCKWQHKDGELYWTECGKSVNQFTMAGMVKCSQCGKNLEVKAPDGTCEHNIAVKGRYYMTCKECKLWLAVCHCL